MEVLKSGNFYGQNNQKSVFKNSIITDTDYIHSKVDWHYHENPYFTFLIEGNLFEANKKESYQLQQGCLLFHNWQDAHYNVRNTDFARGFHIELDEFWFSNYDVKLDNYEGSLHLKNPLTKSLMNKIFIEFKLNDSFSNLSIDALIIELFNTIENPKLETKKPLWIKKLQELFLEEEIDYSLDNLSTILEIHPIHLSREFSRYFGTSLGNYIRILKTNKALHLILSKQHTLTEICYLCGFYDQSHFISNFKRIYNTLPNKLLRKIIEC